MWDPQAAHWRIWKSKDGLNGSLAREMILAPDGAVWVLCYPGGLTRFDPESLTPEKIKTPDPVPTGIHVGPDGRIWIANAQYVKAMRPSQRPFQFVDVPLPPEINHGIGRFTSSTNGVLWAVGRSGISRFDGKNWLPFARLPMACCRTKLWKPQPSTAMKSGFVTPDASGPQLPAPSSTENHKSLTMAWRTAFPPSTFT